MTVVRQMQVSYEPIEDRLLLRVAMNNQDEFRIFLTRRLLRAFWPHLLKILQRPTAPLAEGGVAELPTGENFATPFNEHDANYPLGLAPLLVAEANFDVEDNGVWRLTFRERRGRGIALHFTPNLLETLRAMIAGLLPTTDWDFVPATGGGGDQPVPSHLH
jgi:hypothetical protein